MTSVGVVHRCACVTGERSTYWLAGSFQSPSRIITSYIQMSDVRWNDTLFDTTDIATEAPKRSVCPTAHPAMKPPYDRPAMPSRSGIGDAVGDARVDAGHHVLEVHAARVADHRLRERMPSSDAAARVGQQARVPR